MNYLFILNDPPYGTERSYNGLRLAQSLAKADSGKIRIFLIGEAAGCGAAGQVTAEGHYSVERVLKSLVARGAEIGVCGTCMEARGLKPEALVTGAYRSTMAELTQWTQAAERVLVF